ncbi:MAG: hypothetical protein ACOYBS_11665 [Flavobacterium sp.]
MKKYIIILVTQFFSALSFAQVGIGTIAPVTGSLLELKATDKALIITRIAGSEAVASPIDGMVVYDTSLNCFRSRENGVWTPCWNCCAMPSTVLGTITSLNCSGVVKTGTLTNGVSANVVSSEFTYTGGNGGTFSGQAISSSGVTGLTATLLAGNFATGTGSITFIITGTPASTGTASFALSIAGQNCTLNLTVN